MLEPIDLRRIPVLLALLAAGMFVCTLLVRPGPPGSERYERERLSRRRRRVALQGMLLITLVGLSSGLAGGLLQAARGDGLLTLLLYALYRVCWLPAYLLRDLQLALAQLGLTGLDVLGLLGLLLVPVFWFLVLLGAGRWWPRS